MSFSIDTAFVIAFEAQVHHLAQQMGSLLRGTVREKTVTGKTARFERLAAIEMAEVVNRHSTITLADVTHSRRQALMRFYAATELIDDEDEVRGLISPQSEYARAFAQAMNRRFDDTVIASLNGAATSVDAAEAESSVTLPVAQVVAAGGLGLTFEKINEAVRRLNLGDVPQDNRHAIASPHGVEDLLAETEVTSSDFSTLRALMNGSIDRTVWMGFTWHMSTRLPITGTTRSGLFYHHDGCGVGVAKEMSTTINVNPERNNATQVHSKMGLGGVRIDDAMVVRVDYVE